VACYAAWRRRWQDATTGLDIGSGADLTVRASSEGVLSIVDAIISDSGNYTCLVWNSAAVRRQPFAVVVSGQFSSVQFSCALLRFSVIISTFCGACGGICFRVDFAICFSLYNIILQLIIISVMAFQFILRLCANCSQTCF